MPVGAAVEQACIGVAVVAGPFELAVVASASFSSQCCVPAVEAVALKLTRRCTR